MPTTRPMHRLISVMTIPATASPLTNFDAPSSDPKKLISRCSWMRRRLASWWSMAPAFRSPSMANCLPGSESSAKRAATSAMRPEPLVMTMKFTTEITAKIVIPTRIDPPATNSAKPLMTEPAASLPFCPSVRISRVDDTFSDSRITRLTSSRTGNA